MSRAATRSSSWTSPCGRPRGRRTLASTFGPFSRAQRAAIGSIRESRSGLGPDVRHKAIGANDKLYGGTGDDVQLQGGDGDDFIEGGDGKDDFDGGAGNDTLMDGPGNDHLSADEGNDTLHVKEGVDDVYGEPGADEIFVLNDGEADQIYCADKTEPRGDAGDKLILVGGRDALDQINYCPAAQRISVSQYKVILRQARLAVR